MDVNRNQYFAVGVVVLLLGLQFRYVESFTLNETTSNFIQKRLKKNTQQVASTNSFSELFGGGSMSSRLMTVRPPNWIGWALLSTGAVLVLHSMVMRKPQ